MKWRTQYLIAFVVGCMVFPLISVGMENAIEARGSSGSGGKSSSTKSSSTKPSTTKPSTKKPTNSTSTSNNSTRSIIYNYFYNSQNAHLTYQQLQQDYQYSKKNKLSLSKSIKPKDGRATGQNKQVLFTVTQGGHKYQVSYARGAILLQDSCKFAFQKESDKAKLSVQCQVLEVEDVTTRDLQYFYIEVDDQYVFYIPDGDVNYSNVQEIEEGIHETKMTVTDEIATQ
ncbi:hypothetical protein [Risungbinella massiliensis]|uniref:hypothetical protein n=1 Tax=Risungbinella massiliensis TaxID=1329796 RepID=UPI000699CCF3|nr:hypothetical protein [Risungbinella massiliensis]